MSGLVLAVDSSTTSTGWALFDGANLLDSGVIKAKRGGNYVGNSNQIANSLRLIQRKALDQYGKPFEAIVLEKNSATVTNQQTTLKLGMVMGAIISRCVADTVYLVNIGTWRGFWKIRKARDEKKDVLKTRAVQTVKVNYKKEVGHDEADAILVGGCFVGKIDKSKFERYEV